MSDSPSPDGAGQPAPERQRRYEQLLGVLDHNTGWPDEIPRAGLCEGSLRIHMHLSCGWDSRETSMTIRAAYEQGAIISWSDESGTTRFARTTPDGLRKVIAEQNARSAPDRQLIEQCVELLDEAE